MANSLLITKLSDDSFSFVVNGDVVNAITNLRNDMTSVGDEIHIKSSEGANLIKLQQILYNEVTIVDGATLPVATSPLDLRIKLRSVGFWDWMDAGGGSGADRFDDLLDTFEYFGNDGMIPMVDESQLKLVPFALPDVSYLYLFPAPLVANKGIKVNAGATAYEFYDIVNLVTQFIRSGYTTTAPSEDVVYQALALKLNSGSYTGTGQDLKNEIDVKTENSAGAIQGFTVTNNGNGTVNIATGTAFLRSTNDQYAPLVKYTIPAVTNLALTDNANNYVLVDYNGGTPALTVTTNSATINTETNSLAILISRVGNTLDWLSLVGQNNDANAKIRIRFLNQEGIRRANGAVIGLSNRNLTLTAGTLFSGLIRINSPAFNTASPDTFTYVYNNGAVWTRVTGQTQVNNTQYNNGGTLTTMPGSDFRTDYVYLLPNNPSKLYVVYGTTTYANITLARNAPTPTSLPSELQVLGLLVGRQIIQRNAPSISEVTSAFTDVFAGVGVPEHNALAGLQGGAVNDYQHLTTTQLNGLIQKNTIAQIRAFSGTLTNTIFYTTDLNQEGNWYYDASDTTSADNTGTILVTADGKRIKRVVQNRTIDPNWFGLKGDNSFDNTTLLKNMITSLGDGFVYEFKTGTYVLSDYIPVPNKITVSGLGNVIFKQNTNYKTIFNVTADGCSFDNFTTQQTGKSQEINFPYGYGAGITFFRVKSGYANKIKCYDSGDETNLDVSSVSGAGIYISGSDNIKVTNCSFYNCRMGINIDDYQNVAVGNPARFTASYNDILNSHFEDNYFGINIDFGALGGGIDFKPGIIKDCEFVRVTYGKSAIESKTFACKTPQIIENPQITGGFLQAIAFIFGSYYSVVRGGYINGAYDGIAMYQQPSQAESRYILIDGIVIENCTNSGIYSNSSYDCTIANSEISLCKYGVWATNFTWNLELNNNNIHNNKFTGVKFDEVLGGKIIGGSIINNSTDGVGGGSSGIIINEPNIDGRISGIDISGVTFDYSYVSSDAVPSTNQLNAIKSVGNYFASTSKTVPGVFRDNFLGRCAIVDSKTEISGLGLAYRSNSKAGTALIDFPEYLNIKNRKIFAGSGIPNGTLIGSVGDIYMREDGSLRNSMYVKTSGAATNTGWTNMVSFAELVLSDMNDATGFSIIRSTNTCLNTPIANTYFQGIQFAANSDNAYANQIVYDIQGNCYERVKDNNVWGSWRARDAVKLTEITSVSTNVFSGARNQIIIQDFATSLTNPLITDPATFQGLTKLFKNKGVGNMVISLTGTTIDGSGTSITLATGEIMLLVCTAINTYKTVYRENISLKADLASPTFTGDPKAPTPVNPTSIANKAYVDGLITAQPKVYKAIVSQIGTADPTAVVIANTLGGTVVWTRTAVGNYRATLAGAFPAAKTLPLTGVTTNGTNFSIGVVRGSDDYIFMDSFTSGILTDSTINNQSVSFEVYP